MISINKQQQQGLSLINSDDKTCYQEAFRPLRSKLDLIIFLQNKNLNLIINKFVCHIKINYL